LPDAIFPVNPFEQNKSLGLTRGRDAAMLQRMTKDQAIAHAGSATKLAAILGLTKQAVSMWGQEIPPLRLYQLRERKPKWFRVPRKA
jgi:DNA-binding transcriptional regulator Cro